MLITLARLSVAAAYLPVLLLFCPADLNTAFPISPPVPWFLQAVPGGSAIPFLQIPSLFPVPAAAVPALAAVYPAEDLHSGGSNAPTLVCQFLCCVAFSPNGLV